MIPAFAASEHNERIKHAYGNYNFWSWLRYWYIDSVNLVTLTLLDRSYYDYDFEKVEKQVRWEDTVKTDEEVADMLAMFGMGPKAQQKPETLDDIQQYIIREEINHGS